MLSEPHMQRREAAEKYYSRMHVYKSLAMLTCIIISQ